MERGSSGRGLPDCPAGTASLSARFFMAAAATGLGSAWGGQNIALEVVPEFLSLRIETRRWLWTIQVAQDKCRGLYGAAEWGQEKERGT